MHPALIVLDLPLDGTHHHVAHFTTYTLYSCVEHRSELGDKVFVSGDMDLVAQLSMRKSDESVSKIALGIDMVLFATAVELRRHQILIRLILLTQTLGFDGLCC
jgi:hypothetical protein